ncbi:MAG: DUF4442 domain-containing protein [Flavobacterium sp.]|nr:MAG: DUF4442 domain-containing protein [Flavobacterium sp.]
MRATPKNVNLFLMLKLPAAFLCGVRVKSLSGEVCTVSVKHKWINQNPFRSMYFAVQAMAAELSTGALVLSQIKETGMSISMLVGSNRSFFHKKATGLITFSCADGNLVSEAISTAVSSGEGQSVTLKSVGTNQKGEVVSEMEFDWQIKVKLSSAAS